MIDLLFFLAVGALGWGLSLATYRTLATRNGWPMGEVQEAHPGAAMLLGLGALAIALVFAAARGSGEGGWVIIVFGLGLGAFWSGFLRVGAQTALLLAPLAAAALLLAWLIKAVV
jgi:hypothetical protein